MCAGVERLPIEAVLCGAVFLTSADCEAGSAAAARDFPLVARHHLAPGQISAALVHALDAYAEEMQAQAPLRELYAAGTTPVTMENEAREWLRAVEAEAASSARRAVA